MINANKVAMAFAAVVAAWHALWSTLVALGVAQAVLDFVLWMHFIRPVYLIAPFDLARAAGLVLLSFVFSYALAYAVAQCWNGLQRNAGRPSLRTGSTQAVRP